jgi:hypothetical protein
MTQEEKLFQKVSEEIKKQFGSIGDEKVKSAVETAFSQYENAYKEHTEKELKVIQENIDKINKSFDELDDTQTKEVATQLSLIEEKLTAFEATLRKQGEKIAEGMTRKSTKLESEMSKEISTYLGMALPNEGGTILYDAMEGMTLGKGMGEVKEGAKTNKNFAIIPTSSMFAALDPMTNANSTAGQAVARDMNTMGFRNIPPILNDHVADMFTTPPMERKAFMTLRIFHTYEDGAGIKAEGTAAFVKSSVQLKSQDFKVFTYGTMYTISVEEFEDVPEITTELENVVPDRLMNDLDKKIFTTGGDNSAAPWGAFSTNATHPNCTLFNPYLYAGSNPKADVADIVAKMKLQVRSQNYRSNGVVAHDTFYDNYEGLRDADGNSLMDRRVQFSPTGEIVGMSGLATRKTRVMDELAVFVTSTPSEILGIRSTVMMQAGLATGDFEKHNLSTKFWGRYAYGAKDALANIYTPDFVADIAILKMDAATALAYTQGVALGTAGFDQANVTISLLKTAGCTDLVDANETAYQVAIEAEASILDLAALQAVIDTVNAA